MKTFTDVTGKGHAVAAIREISGRTVRLAHRVTVEVDDQTAGALDCEVRRQVRKYAEQMGTPTIA